jgi:uncharacterized protein (UPF0264 family)
MMEFGFDYARPGLLVSVRNATEAIIALSAGAEVIDVKEPRHGALGRASSDTIADVVAAVAGRAPVTAAFGELRGLADDSDGNVAELVPCGVSLFKIGLAGCAQLNDWPHVWRKLIAKCSTRNNNSPTKPVAVVYADWKLAHAPEPHQVLNAATELGCPALLIDTWEKTSGTAFDHWPFKSMKPFIELARRQHLQIVLAGSLGVPQIPQALDLDPDLIAVRGAACENGRGGAVSYEKVLRLKQLLASSTIPERSRALNQR